MKKVDVIAYIAKDGDSYGDCRIYTEEPTKNSQGIFFGNNFTLNLKHANHELFQKIYDLLKNGESKKVKITIEPIV